MKTVRLTMAQALVRYLTAQRTVIDRREVPLFAGVFAIFGHGNVTCLGEALEPVQDVLPTWRGQNEQSMALAAVAYAKAKRRRQIMIAAASIGPGSTNMVTAAAVALANRLPVLLLGGDTFANRIPIRCCSRSSTSAIRRRPSTTPSSRSPAIGTGSAGPSRSSRRCPRRSRRCSIPAIADRPSSRWRRTPRPRPTTIP